MGGDRFLIFKSVSNKAIDELKQAGQSQNTHRILYKIIHTDQFEHTDSTSRSV
jgi:hypothetical protein